MIFHIVISHWSVHKEDIETFLETWKTFIETCIKSKNSSKIAKNFKTNHLTVISQKNVLKMQAYPLSFQLHEAILRCHNSVKITKFFMKRFSKRANL